MGKIICSSNDRKNVCSVDCNKEKFSARFTHLLVYTKSV